MGGSGGLSLAGDGFGLGLPVLARDFRSTQGWCNPC
jgi:hypothetical protein